MHKITRLIYVMITSCDWVACGPSLTHVRITNCENRARVQGLRAGFGLHSVRINLNFSFLSCQIKLHLSILII